MSNANMDYLYPEFWAAAFDEADLGSYNLQKLISRKYENKLAQKGDTVNVPLTPEMSADDWTPGSSITADSISQERAQLALDKSKAVPINLTGAELSYSAYELIESYGVPMAEAVLAAVNEEIYKEALKSTYVVASAISSTTAGSPDEDDVVNAMTLLNENKVTKIGRSLVCAPADFGALAKTDAFQYANYSGDGGRTQREGQVDRKFGFDIFENHACEKYTPADVAGAINHPTSGSYAIGTTTIAVDAFDDDATPVRAGDIFQPAGSTSHYYSITATDVTSDDTTELTFAYRGSGLLAAEDDNDVITIIPSRSMLAFSPSAMAFAARPYAMLPEGAGVKSTVINVDGLPIRISVWHDGKLGVNVQADVLFGVKLVNQKRMARIITG